MTIDTNMPVKEFIAQLIETMRKLDTNALTLSVGIPVGTATFRIEWLSVDEPNTAEDA